MKTSLPLFIVLLLFVANLTMGQNASVTGVVVEKDTKEPIEFVNVVLYQPLEEDKKLIQGLTTDLEGQFRFQNVSPGEYFVEVSFIGFESKQTRTFKIDNADDVIDFNKINLKTSAALLDEVEIVAEKKMFNNTLKKKTYNVEKDLMSQTSSATEMLQNLPSVRVDVNGQVSLRGSSNITFLINGKPSPLMRASSTSALQQIPASTIERIEVLTNPSAKYNPNGAAGVINIVLKKEKLEGWNAVFQGNVGNLSRYNGNLTLNYNKNNVNFFGGYGRRSASTPQDINDIRINKDGGGRVLSTFNNVSKATFDESSHLANAGMTWNIGEKSMLEIAGEYFFATQDNNSLTNWDTQEGDVNSIFNIDRMYDSREKEYEVGASFEHQFDGEDHTLALDFTYGVYDESEDNFYDEMHSRPTAYNALSRNLIEKGGPLMEVAVEWAKLLAEDTEMEAGYVGEFIQDEVRLLGEDLEGTWIVDPSKTNQFNITQNVHAAYAILTQGVGSLVFSAGLRAEQALINSELNSSLLNSKIPNDYFKLFPSASITYEINDYDELMLSYSKRINRPDTDEQNPFPEYDDPRTRDAGNPLLLPEIVHSAELSYYMNKGRFTFIPSLYYRHKEDAFTEFREIQQDSILHTSLTNLGEEQAAGLELIFSGNVTDGINFNFSSNFFYNEINASNLGFLNKRSQFSWDAKLAANLTLSKNTYAQLNSHYISSRLTPQGEFRPLILLNAGLRKDILKDQASLVLTISDVFASLEWESVVDTPELYWKTTYGRNNQVFHVGFIYRIGKTYVDKKKKIEFEDMIEQRNPPPPKLEEEEEG